MIGLKPRSMSWVLPHRLGIGERPGGSGTTHRRIRREEEIFWLGKQDFGGVLSLLPTTHNLQAYEEAGLEAVHIPLNPGDAIDNLPQIFAVLDDFVRDRQKKIYVHSEDVEDQLVGVCGAYLLHLGIVPNHATAVATIEAVTSRPLGPDGRAIVEAVEIMEAAGDAAEGSNG